MEIKYVTLHTAKHIQHTHTLQVHNDMRQLKPNENNGAF